MFPVITIMPLRRFTIALEQLSSAIPCGTKSVCAPGTLFLYSAASSLFTKVTQLNRFACLRSYRHSRSLSMRCSGLEYQGHMGSIFLVFNAGGSSRLQIAVAEFP